MVVSWHPKADVAWGRDERLRLRAAREHAGHDMEACAEILRTEFGVEAASQPNLSRWETGTTKRPHSVHELLAYCDAYGPNVSSTQSARDESRTWRAGDASFGGLSPRLTGDEVDEFDRLAGQAAGEPLLGAAQLELIRGMNRRLASGPPLSPEDRATYKDQLRILGVPDG
jgi:transcriptional regulator with XRE-family HTH domain